MKFLIMKIKITIKIYSFLLIMVKWVKPKHKHHKMVKISIIFILIVIFKIKEINLYHKERQKVNLMVNLFILLWINKVEQIIISKIIKDNILNNITTTSKWLSFKTCKTCRICKTCKICKVYKICKICRICRMFKIYKIFKQSQEIMKETICIKVIQIGYNKVWTIKCSTNNTLNKCIKMEFIIIPISNQRRNPKIKRKNQKKVNNLFYLNNI